MSILGIFKQIKKAVKHTSEPTPKNEVDTGIVYKQKLACGLLPGEIVLLHWIKKNCKKEDYPRYFSYKLSINPSISYKNLLHRHLIEDTQLTDKGLEILKQYQDYATAYYDRYFSIPDYVVAKSKYKLTQYGDIKWSFLNDEAMLHTKELNFGLLRNTKFAQAVQLESENKPVTALAFWLEVLIFDCSGLSNGYKYHRTPIYKTPMLPPDLLKKLIKCKSLCSEDEIKKAFARAKQNFQAIDIKSFVSQECLKQIEASVINNNFDRLETYLKRFDTQH